MSHSPTIANILRNVHRLADAVARGRITPQARQLAAALLAPPHPLAAWYTAAVKQKTDQYQQHDLRVLLEALGAIANGRKAQDADLHKLADALGGTPANTTGKKKAGRKSKEDSAALRQTLAAMVREHGSLKYDIPTLAKSIGISESQARRYLDDEEKKYLKSAAANTQRDEE